MSAGKTATCPSTHMLLNNRHLPKPSRNRRRSKLFHTLSLLQLPNLLLYSLLNLALRYHLATSLVLPSDHLTSTSTLPTTLLTTPLVLYTPSTSPSSIPKNIPNGDRYPVHFTTTSRTPVAFSTYNPLLSVSPQNLGTPATTSGYPQPIYNTNHNNNHISANAIVSNVGVTYTNEQSSNSRLLELAKLQQSRPQLPSSRSQPQQTPQPKLYKFTITAGKYWRFNIKSNSLTTSSSHKNRELRLHKNITNNNFIIDDDSWFQYNPQQQQLFGWPSLLIKPATYYFVLMPIGGDIEATEDENGINNLEITASIIVELIKPINAGTRLTDSDSYTDYKFSLENIHRHPSYPLLLNQIVSVFEYITSPIRTLSELRNEAHSIEDQQSANKNVGISRSSFSKLNEYLLINSTLQTGGEYFTLSWTYEPSLINNTITPRSNECRVHSILDTLNKFSRPSLASFVPISQTQATSPQQLDTSRSAYNNSTIYYPITISQFNLQYPVASILAEQVNSELVLKLTLNNPCRKSKVFDEVVGGLIPVARINNKSNTTDILKAIPNENKDAGSENITSLQQQTRQHLLSQLLKTQTSSPNSTPTTISYTTSLPQGTAYPRIDSLSGVTSSDYSSSQNITKTPTIPRFALESTTTNSPPTRLTAIPTSEPYLDVSKRLPDSAKEVLTTRLPTTLHPQPPSQLVPISASTSTPFEHWQTSTQRLTLREQQHQQTRPPLLHEAPSTSINSLSTVPTTEPTIGTIKSSHINVNTSTDATIDTSELRQSTNQDDQRSLQSPTKTPPQAKSLANFFEIAEVNNFNTVPSMSTAETITDTTTTSSTIATQVPTINSNITETNVPLVLNNLTDNVPLSSADATNSTSASIVANESSLNEDLIGILNDVMEYIISVAVPVSIIIGAILLLSILIALCSLRAKRKKSQQFEVGDRFKHRYGSERKAFLKNSSRPVILESDQKSLSTGGTPQHFAQKSNPDGNKLDEPSIGKTYLKMKKLSHGDKVEYDGSTTTSFWLGSGGAGQSDPGAQNSVQSSS